MMDFEKRLTEIAGAANVKLEEPMKNHTTFRIGGPARYFVTPENADALILVIGLCRGEEKPFAVIGNGSNLLVNRLRAEPPRRGGQGFQAPSARELSAQRTEGESLATTSRFMFCIHQNEVNYEKKHLQISCRE